MRHLALLLLVTLVPALAQQPAQILDRRVSVSFNNEKLPLVLNRIGQQAGFSFSYNSTIIASDQVVSIALADKTVREVLNELFKGSMNYKEKFNHLILTKVPVKQSKASVTQLIISGYVENSLTKEKIVDASIYEKKTIAAVLSDEFGFFRLRVDKRSDEPLIISVSKKNFVDTTLMISEDQNQYFHVSLLPVAPPAPIVVVEEPPKPQPDTTSSVTASITPSIDTATMASEPVIESHPDEPPLHDELELPYETSPNVENISDTLHRLFQVSVIPFVGTNGVMSGNIVNDYSINLFGGYSLGTRYFELGGFFNIDRGDVGFLQVAGMANVNGGSMSGVQVGGFFNMNGGETNAVQVAGFSNVNFEDAQGVLVAGLTNVNLGAARGVQVAGLVNCANGWSDGLQVAGLGNIHIGNFDGPQISGLTNFTRGTVRGSQISSLFNRGDKVFGTQIGFINSADSLTGVPIGFLSFVRHGYHKIELSADEVFYANLAFRTGVRRFYNIVMAGIKTDDSPDVAWTFGYGIGTAPRLIGKWLFMNIDLTVQQMNVNEMTGSLSMLNKLHLGLDFQIARKFSIYAGATLNAYLTEVSTVPFPGNPFPFTPTPINFPLFSDYQPHVFHDEIINGDVRLRMWWGAKIALRFL